MKISWIYGKRIEKKINRNKKTKWQATEKFFFWYLICPVTSYRTVVPTIATAVESQVWPWRGQRRRTSRTEVAEQKKNVKSHWNISKSPTRETLRKVECQRVMEMSSQPPTTNLRIRITIESLPNFLVHFCDSSEVQELTHCQQLPTYTTIKYSNTPWFNHCWDYRHPKSMKCMKTGNRSTKIP